jgi:hypothetical protein
VARFPYSDNEIASFYRYAMDPLEQISVCAQLCAVSYERMLKKLCDLKMIPDYILPQAIEEAERRRQKRKRTAEVLQDYNRRRRELRKNLKENNPLAYEQMRNRERARAHQRYLNRKDKIK